MSLFPSPSSLLVPDSLSLSLSLSLSQGVRVSFELYGNVTSVDGTKFVEASLSHHAICDEVSVSASTLPSSVSLPRDLSNTSLEEMAHLMMYNTEFNSETVSSDSLSLLAIRIGASLGRTIEEKGGMAILKEIKDATAALCPPPSSQ